LWGQRNEALAKNLKSMKNLTAYQKAKMISKVLGADIQNNNGSYGLYDKNDGGWIGCVSTSGGFQGMASDNSVLLDAGINPATGERL